MTQQQMPHRKLIGYQLELVRLVARIPIRDARLREQAVKSAARAALNAAEGAARQSRADKSRVYAIALAFGRRAVVDERRYARLPSVASLPPAPCEAVAAVEIAGALGACAPADVAAVLAHGVSVKNVLSRLVR